MGFRDLENWFLYVFFFFSFFFSFFFFFYFYFSSLFLFIRGVRSIDEGYVYWFDILFQLWRLRQRAGEMGR